MIYNRFIVGYPYNYVYLNLVGKAAATDNYILTSAEGLGDPGTDVNISRLSSGGGSFVGRRPLDRQITLNIKLNPTPGGATVSALRDVIYDWSRTDWPVLFGARLSNAEFASKDVASTSGYISKCEPSFFDPESSIQVVIDCPNPYFEAPQQFLTATDDSKFTIDDIGTVESGFIMEVILKKDIESFKLTGPYFYNYTPYMEVVYPMKAGKFLTFYTNRGSRRIQYGTQDITPFLTANSRWLVTSLKSSTFTLPDTTISTFNTLQFVPKYRGL